MRKTLRDFLEVTEFMMEVNVYDEYGETLYHGNMESSLFEDERYATLLDRNVVDFLIYHDRLSLWVEQEE